MRPLCLGDVCDSIVDCEHKTAPTQATGYPLIRTSDIGLGRLDFSQVQRVSEDVYAAWTRRSVPRAGDLILAREAPVGNVGPVLPGMHPVLGQRTVLIRPNRDLVDPLYLNYLLSGPQLRPWMMGVSAGSTVPHLNVKDIRRMPLPGLPPLPTQRKVGAVISAYDELIENNTRQIKVLEEIAQRIYREWFVDFRYPGHGATPLVASPCGPIPEGWGTAGLFDVAEVTFGYPFKSSLFNSTAGLPVTRIRDLPLGETSTLTTEDSDERYLIRDGDILVGMDGEFHMARWSAGPAWLNQRVARFRPMTKHLCRYTLFLALREPIQNWNRAIAGTTVAHLGKRHLEQVRIIVPPLTVAARAAAVFDPLFDEEIQLRKATRVLRASRDLILPRLISGEIDVGTLDIAVPEVVV